MDKYNINTCVEKTRHTINVTSTEYPITATQPPNIDIDEMTKAILLKLWKRRTGGKKQLLQIVKSNQ